MMDTNMLRRKAGNFKESRLGHSAELFTQAADTIDQQAALLAKYREALEWIDRDDIDAGETDLDWGLRMQRFARQVLEQTA